MSLIEIGVARWRGIRHLQALSRFVGLEHIHDALGTGKGVILLSAHFTTLEIMGRALTEEIPPFAAVYRKNRSEFLTELQRSGREASADTTIEKRDIKKMVRALRAGQAVWYAPDQSYNRKGAEVIEFFGVPSMHTTATSTLARLGDALIVPYFPRRCADGTYEFRFFQAWDNFPSGDAVADTKRYVEAVEQHVRRCPEQYLWLHKKFKNLPDDYRNYYADLAALK